MKISVAFVRLQHAHITSLMAEHANIIGDRGWQPSWVDDGSASCPRRLSFCHLHLSDVLLSRAVTVLAMVDPGTGRYPLALALLGHCDTPRTPPKSGD